MKRIIAFLMMLIIISVSVSSYAEIDNKLLQEISELNSKELVFICGWATLFISKNISDGEDIQNIVFRENGLGRELPYPATNDKGIFDCRTEVKSINENTDDYFSATVFADPEFTVYYPIMLLGTHYFPGGESVYVQDDITVKLSELVPGRYKIEAFRGGNAGDDPFRSPGTCSSRKKDRPGGNVIKISRVVHPACLIVLNRRIFLLS